MKLIIKNAFITDKDYKKNNPRDIYIENGIIKKVGNNLNFDAEILDANFNAVIPGLIDMNCKICEAGYENKDNIVTVSKSAAAGGYTSITTSPNTQPIVDNKTVVEYIYSKSRDESKVNIYPYGSMTKGCIGEEAAEIGEMILAGVVAISDGGNTISNSELLKDILLYSKMFDIPIITMCQDRNLSGCGVINSGYMSTKMGLIGNPRESEEIIVARNLILAKYTGARLHISHVTTKGSVELIKYAKEKGVNVTSGTCPHYFTLSEKAVESYNTIAKVYPPLRTEEDIKAIKNGIKDGTIDIIASGHTPAAYNRKMTEFDKAAYGISSLETAFSVSFTNLVNDNDFTIYDLLKRMSENPAKILKLKNKGAIKEGYDADLSIVDIKNEFIIEASKFVSKAKYSLYDNQMLKGKVINTIVKGKIVN